MVLHGMRDINYSDRTIYDWYMQITYEDGEHQEQSEKIYMDTYRGKYYLKEMMKKYNFSSYDILLAFDNTISGVYRAKSFAETEIQELQKEIYKLNKKLSRLQQPNTILTNEGEKLVTIYTNKLEDVSADMKLYEQDLEKYNWYIEYVQEHPVRSYNELMHFVSGVFAGITLPENQVFFIHFCYSKFNYKNIFIAFYPDNYQ